MKRKVKYVAAGYLIENNQVLLTYHIKQNKWVPAGGHIEENETPQEALKREYKEELGIDIEVIDAVGDVPFQDSGIWQMQPRPFHTDFEEMSELGYDHDLYIQFYYVKRIDINQEIKIIDVKEFRWFSSAEVAKLETYEQVRVLGKYAIEHYPG